jgi:hypothetical protein
MFDSINLTLTERAVSSGVTTGVETLLTIPHLTYMSSGFLFNGTSLPPISTSSSHVFTTGTCHSLVSQKDQTYISDGMELLECAPSICVDDDFDQELRSFLSKPPPSIPPPGAIDPLLLANAFDYCDSLAQQEVYQ